MAGVFDDLLELETPKAGAFYDLLKLDEEPEKPSLYERALKFVAPAAESFSGSTAVNPEVIEAPIRAVPKVAEAAWGLAPKVVKEPIEKAFEYTGNVARAIPADVAETISGTEPYYELHNLAAAALGEPLPIDELLKEASTDAPTWTTIGKISQGIAGTAPMMVAFGALPPAAQKLALAGFTVQMLKGVPETAKQLGEELGKPEAERDMDKITSLVSQGTQEVGFGLAGALGTRKAFRPEVTSPFAKRTGPQPGVSPEFAPPVSRQAPMPTRVFPVVQPPRLAPSPAAPLNLPPPAERQETPAAGRELVMPQGAKPSPFIDQLVQEGVKLSDAVDLIEGNKTAKEVVESNLTNLVTPQGSLQKGHAEAWIEAYQQALSRVTEITDQARAERGTIKLPARAITPTVPPTVPPAPPPLPPPVPPVKPKPDVAPTPKRKLFVEMEDDKLIELYHRYRNDYSRRPNETLDKRIELIGDELAYRAGLAEGTQWGNRGGIRAPMAIAQSLGVKYDAAMEKMLPPDQWHFTDNRPDSPTKSVSVTVPKGSTAEQVQAAFDEWARKDAEAKKPAAPQSGIEDVEGNFIAQLVDTGMAETKPLGEPALVSWERAIVNGRDGELPVEYWVRGITDARATFNPQTRSATIHVAGYTADLKTAYETITVTMTDSGSIRMFATTGREPILLKAAIAVTEKLMRGGKAESAPVVPTAKKLAAPAAPETEATKPPVETATPAVEKGTAEPAQPAAQPEPPTAGKATLKEIRERLDRGEAAEPEAGGGSLHNMITDFGRTIYTKGVEFAKWSADMIREIGEKVKPYLKAVWESLLVEKPEGGMEMLGSGIEPAGAKKLRELAAKTLKAAGEGMNWRKSAERAIEATAIPTPVREQVAQSPEALYQPQSMSELVKRLEAMSVGDLLTVPKESNEYVASRLIAAQKLWNEGKFNAGYDTFMEVSTDGTSFGQNINQFKLLPGASPIHIVKLINGGLRKAGRDPLTVPQMERVSRIAKTSMESNKALESAKDEWKNNPTDANADKADQAFTDSHKSDIALQREMSRYQVQNWPKMLKAFAQGNPITPISHIANVTGNIVGAAMESATRAHASVFDMVRTLFSSGERKVMAQPVRGPIEAAKGLWTGAKVAADILKQGSGNVIKGETRQGLRPMVALKNAFAKNPDAPTIKGKVPLNERLRMLVEGTFGIAPETMLRFLAAEDKLSSTPAKARLIAEQLRIKGVPKEQWRMAQKFPELFLDKAQLDTIKSETLDAVFQRESKTINSLNHIIHDKFGDWGDLAFTIGVAPYKLTPWNLIGRTLSYNPLIASIRIGLDLKKGNMRGAEINAGRAAVGTLLYAAGYFLYQNGLIGPSLDTRVEANKARLLSGEVLPPNHVNLSGLERLRKGGNPEFQKGDDTRDLTRGGGAAGAILVTVANIGRSFENKPQASEEWMLSMLRNGLLEQASFTVNQSFLKGVTGILDAVQNRNLGPYINSIENMMMNVPTPNTLSTLTRATRKYVPDMRADKLDQELGNVVRSRFGFLGLDDYLPVKRDLWGKPMLQTPEGRNAILYHFFDISKGHQVSNDPVSVELYNLWRRTSDSKVIPSIPERQVVSEKQIFPMPSDKYSRYVELIGAARRPAVEMLVQNPNWLALPEETKIKLLNKAYDFGHSVGQKWFIDEGGLNGLTPKANKAGFVPKK